MKRNLTITFLAFVMLFGLSQGVLAQERLTLGKILTGLTTKGTTPETNTLAKRNIYITKRVELYGVTFNMTPDFERELRNAGATTVLINAIRANGPKPVNTKPSATFKQLWVDYGVTQGGVKGMLIHLKFTTYNMKGIPAYLAVYFKDNNGIPLKDANGKFNTSTDEVAVYREFTPPYAASDYDDLTVFMPYEELDLEDGKWDLKLDAKLIYKAGGLIENLGVENFVYRQGPERNPATVVPNVIRVWADYGITEGGRRGMRLNVNFEVTGLKGVDSKLIARVQRENGDALLNDSEDYSNDEGHFVGSFVMKPGFPTTVYKDASIFLPYDEFNLARGKWNLKLDVDLVYADGTLIKHLQFYPFEFTQK